MKSWVISSEDDDWKVELDIRDICGHLDTTLQGRPGTISGRIQKENTQLAADGALPLGFKGNFKSCKPNRGHRLCTEPELALFPNPL